jgi:hypothetical protein
LEPALLKVLVAIKRVVDYNVRVRVKPDGSGVAIEGLKMSINPFDEIAIEEALKLKERGQAAEVVLVTVGDSDAQQQLRTGLAMGADRALLIETSRRRSHSSSRARCVRSSSASGPTSCCWASKRSTTTTRRPDRCWQRSGTGRRRRSRRGSRSTAPVRESRARSTRGSR